MILWLNTVFSVLVNLNNCFFLFSCLAQKPIETIIKKIKKRFSPPSSEIPRTEKKKVKKQCRICLSTRSGLIKQGEKYRCMKYRGTNSYCERRDKMIKKTVTKYES